MKVYFCLQPRQQISSQYHVCKEVTTKRWGAPTHLQKMSVKKKIAIRHTSLSSRTLLVIRCFSQQLGSPISSDSDCNMPTYCFFFLPIFVFFYYTHCKADIDVLLDKRCTSRNMSCKSTLHNANTDVDLVCYHCK